jgi:hypothetical protein
MFVLEINDLLRNNILKHGEGQMEAQTITKVQERRNTLWRHR